MNNVERYEAIMKAAFEAKQLKIELNRKLAEISKNITAKELKSRCFDNDDVSKAFAILADGTIKIEPAQYVEGKATYKDVEICLHAAPDKLKSDAMKHVLSELSSNEIFEA